MKVVILGAGVTGVTAAYYLARRGVEVTVLERESGAGLGTSYANGGQISADSGAPWMAPGVPAKAMRWFFQREAPFVVRPRLDLPMTRWLWRAWRNCRPERYRVHRERVLRLARYSRDSLHALRAEENLAYDYRTGGLLHVYAKVSDWHHAQEEAAWLQTLGVRVEILDAAACVAREPGLAEANPAVVGGILYPDDECGDCHQFTAALADRAAALGVAFRYGTEIRGLDAEGDRITGVRTATDTLRPDHVLMALGVAGVALLRPLGVRLPVYPLKGYSVTVPVTDDRLAPQVTVTDEAHKVVISRLGDRVRAAGTAELAGYDARIRDARCRMVVRALTSLYPRGMDPDTVECWAGLRPMTPDGVPVLGDTPYRNLHLNTGHGTLGWTLSCGTARLLADRLTGAEPALDPADYALAGRRF